PVPTTTTPVVPTNPVVPTTYVPYDGADDYEPKMPTNNHQPIIINQALGDNNHNRGEYNDEEEIEESLSMEQMEKELIERALRKHRGRRKEAAKELGSSERTLYPKIKLHEIE